MQILRRERLKSGEASTRAGGLLLRRGRCRSSSWQLQLPLSTRSTCPCQHTQAGTRAQPGLSCLCTCCSPFVARQLRSVRGLPYEAVRGPGCAPEVHVVSWILAASG